MRPRRHRVWDAFLRIPSSNTVDAAPIADDEWFTQRGIYSGAPIVVCLIRGRILPLVRSLQRSGKLDYFYFLIHDRASGVPTSPDDRDAYIHLRLVLRKAALRVSQLDDWSMVRPILDEGDSTAGIDNKTLRGGNDAVRQLIGKQSEWVLDLVEAHRHDDPLSELRQIRQFLHFFANMLQMKVVG